MPKHTPGRWKLLGKPWDYAIYSRIENEDDNPDDVQVATVRRKEDAALFMAAPKLLRILKMIQWGGWLTDDETTGYCPFCESAHPQHEKNCGLAEAIQEAEGDKDAR